MIKKIMACILFLIAGLGILGSVLNGSLKGYIGTSPEQIGGLVGFLLPIVFFVLGGIFLLRFDSVLKKSYVNGYKARKKQVVIIFLFLVISFLFVSLTGRIAGRRALSFSRAIVPFLISAAPYFILLIFLVYMISFYVFSFLACRSKFKLSESQISEFLSDDQSFTAYDDDKNILFKDNILFVHKYFLIIPLDEVQLEKILITSIESDIRLTLKNGKKLTIVTNKKIGKLLEKVFEPNK